MHKKTKDNFFNDLSIATGNMDVGSIRQMYYAMVKQIVRGVVANGKLRLPEFGEFRIITAKERVWNNVQTMTKYVHPPVNVMKFKPDYKLRCYLNDKVPKAFAWNSEKKKGVYPE